MPSFLDCLRRAAATDHDLSVRQLVILLTCAKQPSPRDRQVHVLETTLGFSRPVISRAGAKLVGMNPPMMHRSELPEDRRTCVLTVTTAGHRFIQEVLGEPVARAPKWRRESPAKAFPAIA